MTQITVIPHLDAALVRRDPKPFLGYSDNTNMHQWLWANGIASFYGGSSQVHWARIGRSSPDPPLSALTRTVVLPELVIIVTSFGSGLTATAAPPPPRARATKTPAVTRTPGVTSSSCASVSALAHC
jgi:hypothetical protein